MNVRRVKYFMLFLVAVCLFPLFYGCGGDKKQANSNGKVVEVRFGWPVNGEDYLKLKDEIIPIFEKENLGIKIKLEMQPWDQFWTKLKTQIAASEAPDFWLSDGVYVLEFADRGAIKDVTEWIKRDFDEKDYFALDSSMDPQGRIWGVPREIQTVASYYNKKSFNEVGMKYPDKTWDWDSLLSAAKKLTKESNNKQIGQYGFWSANWISGGWFNFIYQNQGQILDKTKTKSMLNRPEVIEAVEFMVDLIHKYKVSPTMEALDSVGGGNAIFQSQVVAMYPSNYAMSATFNRTKDLDYDVAVLPKGKTRAVSYIANSFVINAKASTEKAEAAWKFIKFFASNENVQKMWADDGYGVPVLKKVVYSKSFTNSSSNPRNKAAFIDSLENGYALSMDLNKCWNEWRMAFTENLSMAWLGQISAKQAVLNGHKDVQTILDRAYK